jgi:uncharacterized repeat protein (TIGR02543 family)
MNGKWKKILITLLMPFLIFVNGCSCSMGGLTTSGGGVKEDIKYTVSFYMGENNCSPIKIEPQEIVSGGKVTKPKDPKCEGLAFIGWFKDADKTQAWTFEVDTVTSNVFLYAKWLKEYIIDFDLVELSTTPVSIPSQIIVDGKRITEPNKPKKSGYTFLGWFTDKEYTEPWDFNSEIHMSLTLYAKWQKNK